MRSDLPLPHTSLPRRLDILHFVVNVFYVHIQYNFLCVLQPLIFHIYTSWKTQNITFRAAVKKISQMVSKSAYSPTRLLQVPYSMAQNQQDFELHLKCDQCLKWSKNCFTHQNFAVLPALGKFISSNNCVDIYILMQCCLCYTLTAETCEKFQTPTE